MLRSIAAYPVLNSPALTLTHVDCDMNFNIENYTLIMVHTDEIVLLAPERRRSININTRTFSAPNVAITKLFTSEERGRKHIVTAN